LVFDLKRRKSI